MPARVGALPLFARAFGDGRIVEAPAAVGFSPFLRRRCPLEAVSRLPLGVSGRCRAGAPEPATIVCKGRFPASL